MSDWRIDELAQRAGVAVDTIRYYQREGMLPTAERNGRSRRYGSEHLERLERIRALQARRFSLAAIRAILDHDEPGGLAALLVGSKEETYDLDELIKAADVDAEFVHEFTRAGVLRDPSEHGRSAYDADDLKLLRSLADLRRLSVPAATVVDVAHVYSDEFDRIYERLVDLFTTICEDTWEAADRDRFRALFSGEMQRFARSIRVIADYMQQRNMQSRVLRQIDERTIPATASES